MTGECERIEHELWLLEAGELPSDRAAGVRDHLASCPACRSLLAANRDVLNRYDEAAARDLDDVTFARLVRRARDEIEIPGRAGPGRAASVEVARSRTWPSIAAGAVAAAGLVLLGIAVGRSTAPVDDDVAALRSEIHELRSTLALSSLDQPSASARLRGIVVATEIDDPRGEVVDALVRTVTRDPSPNVRLAAVDALLTLSDPSGMEERVIEILEREPEPAVRIALIHLLVAWRVDRSLDALRRLERDARDPTVRRHASWAVRALT